VGGTVPTLLRVGAAGALVGLVTGRRLGVLGVKQGPGHLGPLAELCAAGEVAIRIDRTFALDEVPEALRRVGEGRALGKVVVELGRG
jgi:NADPH:quinone reductase-like Zn-dependent oxidoreductase